MNLGWCPYCKDGKIEIKKKEINGRKVELYTCNNAKWETIDGELFELTKSSTCHFKIWQNSLAKYGKYLRQKEIKSLLKNEDVIVTLYSKKYGKKTSYQKYLSLHKDYGVSVIWDINIENEGDLYERE